MANETPDKFIKYLSADGALAMLEHNALRFSAPDRFGDPFELSKLSRIRFDGEGLLDATVKLAVSLIFGRDAPTGDTPLINAILRWREGGRFDSAQEAQPVLRELLGKMVKHKLSHLDELMTDWYNFSSSLRLCCFCIHPNVMSAWEQYADRHRGVAITVNQGVSTHTDKCRAVDYTQERPELTTLKEQLSTLVYNRLDRSSERFLDHFFVRSQLYKAEREWRCVKTGEDMKEVQEIAGSGDNYDDLIIPIEDVTAAYLGIAIEDDIKASLLACLKEKYPHAKIYQGSVSKMGYNVAFEQIEVN